MRERKDRQVSNSTWVGLSKCSQPWTGWMFNHTKHFHPTGFETHDVLLLLLDRCYKDRQLVGVHNSEICPGAENCCWLQVKVRSHDASVQRTPAPPLTHFNKSHNDKFKNGLPVLVRPPAVSSRLTGETFEFSRSANRNTDWVLKCRLHYSDVFVQYDITSFYRSEYGAVLLDRGLM